MERSELRRIVLALLALAVFGIGAIPMLRFAPRDRILLREAGLTPNSAESTHNKKTPAIKKPSDVPLPLGAQKKTPILKKPPRDAPPLSPGPGVPKLGGPLRTRPGAEPPVLEIVSAEPRYWRMASYDTFDGDGWTQRPGASRRVDCGEALRVGGPGYKQLDIAVRILEGVSFTQLLAPLFPAKVCAGSALVSFETDSLAFIVDTPLPAGSRYTVSSIIEQYSMQDLRAASADYPREIRERYLQLPQGTPSRIRELALSVTAGASNDFDRAKKIEAFLGRSGEYPYTLEPPPTPKGRNGVDYFLFDIKRGYCSYFASAMAVLLRSIGIPSRVASGFAPGKWNASTRSVALHPMEAHAWVEVYFPGYGWVEFEPTGGGPAQPELTTSGRAENPASMPPPETKKPEPEASLKREEKKPPVAETAPDTQDTRRRHWLYALAALLAAVPAGWGARQYWLSSRRPGIGIPGSRRGAAGRSAAVPPAGTADFDIRFPWIEPDLPLYWGTVDPPLEILVVKPEGAEVSLTVNGEERALPGEKGEYLLEIRHDGRSVVKVVNIIDYGEEIERDFREFIIQHGLEGENITARQLLDRIYKADPGFKRPEKALTLFENYAYGNKMIARDEYVRYYRSGRFGPVPLSVIK